MESRALAIFVAAAAAAGLTPASAQCRLCDTPTTALSQSPDGDGIELDIQTTLDFDRLILSGSGQGAAVIRPDGSSSAQGALTQVSARAMVGSASVHGTPGRAVRVELPRRIDLYSLGGGRITVDDVATFLRCRGSIRRGTSHSVSADESRLPAIRRAIIAAICRLPSNISEPPKGDRSKSGQRLIRL
jgi:hypothetical protein